MNTNSPNYVADYYTKLASLLASPLMELPHKERADLVKMIQQQDPALSTMLALKCEVLKNQTLQNPNLTRRVEELERKVADLIPLLEQMHNVICQKQENQETQQ